MKRFLLFVGDFYYPAGGWKDYRGSFETLEAAQRIALRYKGDWYHVVDSLTGAIVDEFS